MTDLPPRRPLASLPIILLAVGIGLTAYYGDQWRQLPRYSDADIDASAALNLEADLQRLGAARPTDAPTLARMREQVRAEVVHDIKAERQPVESGLGIGLIALMAGLANLGAAAWLRRRAAAP